MRGNPGFQKTSDTIKAKTITYLYPSVNGSNHPSNLPVKTFCQPNDRSLIRAKVNPSIPETGRARSKVNPSTPETGRGRSKVNT